MWRSPSKAQQEQAKRDVLRLFDTELAALYRLVRRNLARGREPLALHKGGAEGYHLSAVTGERVQRDSFLGVVNEETTVDDLQAMTGDE